MPAGNTGAGGGGTGGAGSGGSRATGGAASSSGGGGSSLADAAFDSTGEAGPADLGAIDMNPVHDAGPTETGDAPAHLTCGDGTAMLPTTGEVAGLVVAPDGTIYYVGGLNGEPPVMRIRPGQAPDVFTNTLGPGAMGITYDPIDHALYVAMFFSLKIMRLDASEPTRSAVPVANTGVRPQGLTIGEDRALYYSDAYAGTIVRKPPTGLPTKVTASPLPGGASGLAFGKDGKLYVTQYTGTDVMRLTLDALGQETARDTFASLGVKGGAGLAFADDGHLFVTAGRFYEPAEPFSGGQIFEIDPSGKVVATMPGNGPALDFGTGALRCSDLYLAGVGVKAASVGRKGMDVPWHRRP
jgi:streptogramin lyase